MSWIPLDYMMKRINERKFAWIVAPHLKYLDVRIDTRDDHAILLDRDGKMLAQTKEELDALFDGLNAKAKVRAGNDREAQTRFYSRIRKHEDPKP